MHMYSKAKRKNQNEKKKKQTSRTKDMKNCGCLMGDIIRINYVKTRILDKFI